MRTRPPSRPAATLVEFAITGSVTVVLLLGIFVGGLGMFRYQQVARLAREASRWASVHGTDYATATGNSAATASDVYNQAIVPNAVGLDVSQLNYSVNWNTSNSPSHSTTVSGQSVSVANTVTVTVTYKWVPKAFLSGVTMSSTSVSVMYY
jgi:Flp pilus assembly protein TadG